MQLHCHYGIKAYRSKIGNPILFNPLTFFSYIASPSNLVMSQSPVVINASNNSLFHALTFITINITTQFLQKLSKCENYALWYPQFTNPLYGYDILGYLNKTFSCQLER